MKKYFKFSVFMAILVALSMGLTSCGSNSAPDAPKTFQTVQKTEKTDNSWLIGSWGPVNLDVSGAAAEIIESMQIQIDILDEHKLVYTTLTKVTPVGLAARRRKNPSAGSSPYSSERETYIYTIDNKNNTINYDDGYVGGGFFYFNKESQTLNFGSQEKPVYMRKRAGK
jgi:hypothetical protein